MKKVFKDITAEEIHLYGLGDVHIGDKHCNYERLQDYLDWIMEPDRYCILMGDIVNCATLGSPSNVHEQDLTLDEQKDVAVDLFEPLANEGKIICAITGNHENRLNKQAGSNPMRDMCRALKVPYCGYSVEITLQVVSKKLRKHGRKKNWPRYILYAHHTKGGGATLGGKMNRVVKLSEIHPEAHVYFGAHSHGESVGKHGVKGKEAKMRDRVFVNTGAFLSWDDSYAEEHQLAPSSSGTPHLLFSGIKRQVHATIYAVWDD